MLTITVVLSAYNGEKHIKEQLNSLLKQTRTPNEVLIGDDCSNDHTVDIIKEFISYNHLNNWTLIQNKENVGWKKNFRNLILSASSDLIFLCDQDDFWYANKIEDMATIMEKRSEIDLLACSYIPQYDDNTTKISDAILKGMNNTKKIEKVRMSEHFLVVLRPGCTYVFRKSFSDQIKDEWKPCFAHDAMLWSCAILNGSAFVYQSNLITWRRYKESSSTFKTCTNKNINLKNKYNSLLNNIELRLLFIESIYNLIDKQKLVVDSNTDALLRQVYEFGLKIKDALLKHDCVKILKIDFKYRKFLFTPKRLLVHLYLAFKTR